MTTTTTKKTRTTKKESAPPHIPNAETEEAMRDVLEGRTKPVSLDELKKRLFGDDE